MKKIRILDLRADLQPLAKSCDKNNDNFLKNKEVSVFEQKYKEKYGVDMDNTIYEHPWEVTWKSFKEFLKKLTTRPMDYDYDKLDQVVAENEKVNTPKIEANKNLFAPKSFLKQLAKCDPMIVDAAIEIGKQANQQGYKLLVSDGFRPKFIQEEGHRKKPDICAPPGFSAHEAGLALDAWLIDSNGKTHGMDESPTIPDYLRNNGFEWGGDWEDPHEVWHFNKMNWRDTAIQYCKNNN